MCVFWLNQQTKKDSLLICFPEKAFHAFFTKEKNLLVSSCAAHSGMMAAYYPEFHCFENSLSLLFRFFKLCRDTSDL